MRAAPSSRPMATVCIRIGRPQISCRTFGRSERIRVPLPAAMITSASSAPAIHTSDRKARALSPRLSAARPGESPPDERGIPRGWRPGRGHSTRGPRQPRLDRAARGLLTSHPRRARTRGRSRFISELHGQTYGLKASQIRRLEALYKRKLPRAALVTQDFARQISELSRELGRQVGVLVSRPGRVEYVVVGDASRIELPDFKRVRAGRGRFRGLRLIHTHLRGEGLTRDDETDLQLLRLDAVIAVLAGDDGLPGLVHFASLRPPDGSGELVE